VDSHSPENRKARCLPEQVKNDVLVILLVPLTKFCMRVARPDELRIDSACCEDRRDQVIDVIPAKDVDIYWPGGRRRSPNWTDSFSDCATRAGEAAVPHLLPSVEVSDHLVEPATGPLELNAACTVPTTY